jgi:Berberine and berberine like
LIAQHSLQMAPDSDVGGFSYQPMLIVYVADTEGNMDDKEKSLFDSFADTIKHTFDVATEAAKKALEPEPLKPDEEVVVLPTPPDAFVSDPAPPMIVIVKKKPGKSAVSMSGRYVNYLDDDEAGDPVLSAYGANYRRLQELKTKYDPKSFFRMNQNIRPLA